MGAQTARGGPSPPVHRLAHRDATRGPALEGLALWHGRSRSSFHASTPHWECWLESRQLLVCSGSRAGPSPAPPLIWGEGQWQKISCSLCATLPSETPVRGTSCGTKATRRVKSRPRGTRWDPPPHACTSALHGASPHRHRLRCAETQGQNPRWQGGLAQNHACHAHCTCRPEERQSPARCPYRLRSAPACPPRRRP